eukprot:scaffold48583_cov66-Phaeocystis_antarctica.AAC.3
MYEPPDLNCPYSLFGSANVSSWSTRQIWRPGFSPAPGKSGSVRTAILAVRAAVKPKLACSGENGRCCRDVVRGPSFSASRCQIKQVLHAARDYGG